MTACSALTGDFSSCVHDTLELRDCVRRGFQTRVKMRADWATMWVLPDALIAVDIRSRRWGPAMTLYEHHQQR